MIRRRRLLGTLAALVPAGPLAACGFQPLYGQGPDSPTADLPAIYVDNIGGRFGQLVRENLQTRLDVPNSGAASLYTLSVSPGINAQGIAIQPDNSTTFTRQIGTADWTLRTVGVPPRALASGHARMVDGTNNIDQQYFQSTISNETTQARIAAGLADEIALQLAAWFRREHADGDRHLRAAAG